MLAILIVSIGAVLTGLAINLFLRQRRRPDSRLVFIGKQLDKDALSAHEAEAYAKETYAIFFKAIQRKNRAIYKYGATVILKGMQLNLAPYLEQGRVMDAWREAIGRGEHELADRFADMYITMTLEFPCEDMTERLKGLLTLAYCNYNAEKILVAVLDLMNANKVAFSDYSEDLMKQVQTVGVITMRRQEVELFEKFAGMLQEKLSHNKNNIAATEFRQCMYNWLYRIIRHSADARFAVAWGELANAFLKYCQGSDEDYGDIIDDWIKLAGIACINPYSKLGVIVISQVGEAVFQLDNLNVFRRTVRAAVQVVTMIATRYGMKESFFAIHALADLGRRILRDELIYGENTITGIRTLMLKILVHELLLVFDMLARQKMTISGGELIDEFEELWRNNTSVADTYGKNARKFCQLLLAYWLQTHKTQRDYFTDEQIKGIEGKGHLSKGKSLAHMLYEYPLTV